MQSLAILLRHTFAALAGMLVHAGIATDAGSTGSLVAGLCVYVIVTILSTLFKMELSDSHKQIAQKLAAAFASQFVAALAGWLQADAATVGDPVALSLFLGNITVSRLRGHVPPARLAQWLMLALCLPLASCSSFTKGDAIMLGKRLGLATGDAAVALARIELAKKIQEWVQAEESGDPIKIALASLAMQAAQESLDAAERAIAKERARLDAKQPRDVQPLEITPLGASVTDSYSEQAISCASRERWVSDAPTTTDKRAAGRPTEGRVTIPAFAPQVVAMLKAR